MVEDMEDTVEDMEDTVADMDVVVMDGAEKREKLMPLPLQNLKPLLLLTLMLKQKPSPGTDMVDTVVMEVMAVMEDMAVVMEDMVDTDMAEKGDQLNLIMVVMEAMVVVMAVVMEAMVVMAVVDTEVMDMAVNTMLLVYTFQHIDINSFAT